MSTIFLTLSDRPPFAQQHTYNLPFVFPTILSMIWIWTPREPFWQLRSAEQCTSSNFLVSKLNLTNAENGAEQGLVRTPHLTSRFLSENARYECGSVDQQRRVHVDDSLVLYKDGCVFDEFYKKLNSIMPTTDNGFVSSLLGLELDRSKTDRTLTSESTPSRC